jgi:hypothetical protein
MRRLMSALPVVLCAASELGCAHAEQSAPAPEVPTTAAAAPVASEEGPKTTLRVSATPIEALRSPYFAALEITFENPSGGWHEVRRVDISPERQLFGPALESPMGARLRAWQLGAREARKSSDGPPHLALDTLAADAPASGEAGASGSGAPPQHLLAGAFLIAPGLSIRKWVVLCSPAKDGLIGQDLLLSYELENGQVERVLIQYPKPAADH